jgi:hypothetical protein
VTGARIQIIWVNFDVLLIINLSLKILVGPCPKLWGETETTLFAQEISDGNVRDEEKFPFRWCAGFIKINLIKQLTIAATDWARDRFNLHNILQGID